MPTITKGQKKLRIKKKSGAGLNKTEKKQVDSKIKSALKSEHVLKYFNSQSTDDAVSPAPTVIGNKKQVSVIAFSSTTEFNNAGVAQKYADQEYQPLYLARPFKENDADEALAAQALNGQYCLPKRATTSFSIERVAMEVPHDTTDVTQIRMSETLPISYRIIQVGIKAQQGTQVVVNPNLDLFLDSFGQPTGIDQDNFDRLDCRYAPVNTKKYKVIRQKYGTINQNNIISPSQFHQENTNVITTKNGKSVTHFTIPFQLSARKNGKLFYETPQQAGAGQPNSFTSGGQRVLLLMHYWFDNGHNLLGGAGQEEAPSNRDIQIKTKSTSAFVDAQ